MGRHREEIWAELRDLDDRVTRLEERATFPQVEIPTATLQPRPWQVGDVVRLEAGGHRDWTNDAGRIGTLVLNDAFTDEVLVDDEGDVWLEMSDNGKKTYWSASALTLIRAAGEPESCPDLEREVERLRGENARLKHVLDMQASDYKATCATAQLIESDRDHIRALYTKLQDSHDALTVERLTAERDEALDKLDAMTAERDALRARIEAGRIMYGGMYGHENKFEIWTFEHVNTDTMTARLIDIAPIAADERKGERRVAKLTAAIHRNVRMNDRRRTPGTRADRGES